jgi:hypothetical protein
MPLKVTYFTPAAAVLLCCGAAAGCSAAASGSKGSPSTTSSTTPASRAAAVAARVCQSAGQAARPLLGDGTRVRVADDDPYHIECLISARGIRVDTVAQASSGALDLWGIAANHQLQAFGEGSVHVPSQIPQLVPGLSTVNVLWIPAESKIMATNGTEWIGGTYVTVTVTRRSPGGPSSLAVARAVTRALLASAPRGPNGMVPGGIEATVNPTRPPRR